MKVPAYFRDVARAAQAASSVLVTGLAGLGDVMTGAAEHNRNVAIVMRAAYEVGLPKDDAREVIETWEAHYRTTPLPTDWDVVRDACVLRALGDDWRPGEMPRDWWLR